MVYQGNILGHIVSKNDISTDLDKISIIVDLPRPLNPKGVHIFMGHCGYYRHFIYMYAEISKTYVCSFDCFLMDNGMQGII